MMSSNIPRQVQEAADEAERLEKTLQPNEPAVDPDPPLSGTPEQPPVSQAPAPPAPAVVEPIKPEEDWRQRYLSLQGMFNAEVPRLNAQLKDQAAQLATLQQQLAHPHAQPAPTTQTPKTKLVTDKDVEVFGGDLIDLIKRQSADIVQVERDRMGGEIKSLQAENAELKKQLGGVVEKQGLSARQTYMNDLAREIPDWEALNVDPELLKWMDEVDPLSGLKRQMYLNNAFEQFDVQRTANLFKAFKQAHGRVAPADPAADRAQIAQQELARQVAPGTAKGSAPAGSEAASDRIYTRAQVERFYTDVTKGLYAGKEKEMNRIETEIDQAMASGRVR
jgi:hypothetical protein